MVDPRINYHGGAHTKMCAFLGKETPHVSFYLHLEQSLSFRVKGETSLIKANSFLDPVSSEYASRKQQVCSKLYTFREATRQFSILSPTLCLTHKVKNLLLEDKFSPFRIDPFWKGFFVKGGKQEVTNVVSLYKNGGRIWRCGPSL